jgi:hemerythrin-like domain-containing protein
VLLSLGKRAPQGGIVDLLLECHERIRYFSALALAIGERDASDEERRDACLRCRRYFTEALPLHVADEEESLLPRLRQAEAELDAALIAMQTEHGEHTELLAALIIALDTLIAAPADESARRGLARVAARVADAFQRHLAAEEARIIPKIPVLLTPQEQARVVAELRARRRPARG